MTFFLGVAATQQPEQGWLLNDKTSFMIGCELILFMFKLRVKTKYYKLPLSKFKVNSCQHSFIK